MLDLAQKGLYSFTAGLLTDALASPDAGARRPPPGARSPSRRAVPRRWRRYP